MNTTLLSHRLVDGIGYLTHAEVELIKQVARVLPKDAVCVNIGTGAGTSILALLEERPDLHVHCIDINAENGLAQLIESNMLNHVTRYLGESQTMEWRNDKIDYLFIDGGHLEPEVRGDVINWLPRMKQGGYILFHDYTSPNWPSVKPTADYFMSPYRAIGIADTLAAFKLERKNES